MQLLDGFFFQVKKGNTNIFPYPAIAYIINGGFCLNVFYDINNYYMLVQSNIRSIAIFIAIFSMSAILSSCQKKISDMVAEKVIEQSTGKKVDIKSGGQNITIESEGKKIEFQGNSGVWPADMPADVPKFSYGKIKAVTRAQMPEGQSWTVVCESVPGNIVKDYEGKLKSSGFKTVSTILTSDNTEGGSVSGTKEKLNVTIITGNGTASLSVVKGH